MTIKSTLVAALAFASLVGVANAAEPYGTPYGTWTRPSTGTQVSFYNCGGKLCGKIVAIKDQARKNTVGTVIMKGAAKSGDKHLEGRPARRRVRQDLFRRRHARERKRAQPQRLRRRRVLPRRDVVK